MKNAQIEEDETPASKEEGLERWKEAMTRRFLNGEDDDFEYEEVDESDEWDVLERRESEERWFEDEKPSWSGDTGEEDRERRGETGVQDF